MSSNRRIWAHGKKEKRGRAGKSGGRAGRRAGEERGKSGEERGRAGKSGEERGEVAECHKKLQFLPESLDSRPIATLAPKRALFGEFQV